MTEDEYKLMWRAREVETVREDMAVLKISDLSHVRRFEVMEKRMAEKDKQIQDLQAKIGELLSRDERLEQRVDRQEERMDKMSEWAKSKGK